MKKIFNIFVLLAGVALLLPGCSPDSHSLGRMADKSELNFSVTLDPSNSNQIIIDSDNPEYSVYWEWDNEAKAAAGYSTKTDDVLFFGFAGDYTFSYSVLSDGGLVTADPVTVTIPTYKLDYMSNPLWTYLTGGVGMEKEWVLDLDADGESLYFDGPMYFYGTDDSWTNVTDGLPATGTDSWNWCPDWPSNQWLMPAADFGSLTFGAIVGHTLTADKKVEGIVQEGTYWLDVDNHILTMTNATMLRDEGRISIVTNWSRMKLLSLTNDAMQLGVIRDNDPNDGPCLLVYNFISKDYYTANK